MPDPVIKPLNALANAPMGHFGNTEGPQLQLTAMDEGTVLQLLCSPSAAPTHDKLLNALKKAGTFNLRNAGPEQWFAITDKPAKDDDVEDVRKALGDIADVVDQSAGRIRMTLKGSAACEALSKGVPVDLHPDVFSAGQSATTLCGHLTVHLTRADDDQFEIIISRTYAVSLWESLIEMGREFGIDCRR